MFRALGVAGAILVVGTCWFGAHAAGGDTAELKLAGGGKANAVIVVHEGAPTTVVFAGEELSGPPFFLLRVTE